MKLLFSGQRSQREATHSTVSSQSSTGRYPWALSYYLGHILIYLGSLIIVLILGWLVLKANRIYSSYQTMTQHLTVLTALVTERRVASSTFDLSQLQESVRGTATSMEMIYEEVTPFLPLAPFLGWVPVYGGDLQASPPLLLTARDLSRAGVIVVDSLSPALKSETDGGQASTLSRIVIALAQANADIEQVELLLRRDEALIREQDIKYLSSGMADRVSRLKQYLPQVISGLELARGLPPLLGAESPRTYLILTQNSDELRPTGGYINTAGHIVLDQAQIVEFVMQDSYAVDQLSADYPYPPYPIYQYMAADYWVLRDAGWSPDFPTAARTAISLYELGQGISAEGVIVLDQQALPYLLRALEPIEVEGEQVTSGNVIKLMHQHWAPKEGEKLNKEWWLQRKSFMLALAETIRQQFEQNPSAINSSILVNALQQALAEKHILIYLEDPTWANFLAEKNWAGSLHPTQGDYLMVVDANLGFNKADALVERHLSYQVNLARDGSAQGHVKLTYHHLAQKRIDLCQQEIRYDPIYEQNMERCYWDYLRLIVPAEAQLISGSSIVVAGQHLLRGQPTRGQIDLESLDADKISWGQLFLMAPQETISLDYIYTLPLGTAYFVEDHWEYNLYLQKQPGTLAPTAEVVITLPEGAQLLESQPQPLKQQGAAITYQVSLKTDQEIQLLYSLH